MKNMVLRASVVLLVLVIVLGGACSSSETASPTPGESSPSPSASPPTATPTATPTFSVIESPEGFYQNFTYGFSLHYPPEWEAQEGGTDEPVFTVHNSGSSCVVQVFVEYLTQTLTLDEYSTWSIDNMQMKLSDFEILSEREFQLGDEIAYEQFFTGVESNVTVKAKLVTLLHGNLAFAVLASCEDDIFNLMQETIDGIIYSFELKESAVVGVSREDSLVLYDSGPVTLDPAVMRDTTSARYVLEIFSGLVTLDQNLQVVPDIASRWNISADGKTYTFHLRKDAKFHDGKEVTAHDFKYSFERACDPETGSQTAANYLGDIIGVTERLAGKDSEIRGLKVLDEYTLQITIDAPKSYFLTKLVYPTAFVVDQKDVNSGDHWWREPNGTGPFRLKEWQKDELLILERNDHYYDEVPKLKNVAFHLWGGIPMVMYETSEIDMALVSAFDIERVQDPANPLSEELITIPQMSMWHIGFNAGEPPFDDSRVRQAFCHAIDKEKIIGLVLKGMVQQANGILPPGMPGYNEQLERLEFDPQKARELIEAWEDDNNTSFPSITFTTTGLGHISQINEALLFMWQENLGVEVEILQKPAETYLYNIKEQKGKMYDIGWVADYPDPQNFLDVLFHSMSGDNTGDYSNSRVDTLLEEAREESDTTTRLSLYREIEQLIIDDAACLPLFFDVSYTLVKPYVKGFTATSLPIPWLKYVSIEPHE